jgi:formamidopyrimidine-DNA glycosylase
MPELPEVETIRRGLEPHLKNRRIVQAYVHDHRLRHPVPEKLGEWVEGCYIRNVTRRGKYLLSDCETGYLLIHLGMSGSLRIVSTNIPLKKHDHLNFVLDNGNCLRYRDPRRFGLVLWLADPLNHPLLTGLGPEPLSDSFHGGYLYTSARKRRIPVKSLLMNNRIVTGIGNIYANESLFVAGILPMRPAGDLSLEECSALTEAVRKILNAAIAQGGTTLRDFVNSEGKPGYFKQSLQVYKREGKPCVKCGLPVQHHILAQRATYFCTGCQR